MCGISSGLLQTGDYLVKKTEHLQQLHYLVMKCSTCPNSKQELHQVTQEILVYTLQHYILKMKTSSSTSDITTLWAICQQTALRGLWLDD